MRMFIFFLENIFIAYRHEIRKCTGNVMYQDRNYLHTFEGICRIRFGCTNIKGMLFDGKEKEQRSDRERPSIYSR